MATAKNKKDSLTRAALRNVGQGYVNLLEKIVIGIFYILTVGVPLIAATYILGYAFSYIGANYLA